MNYDTLEHDNDNETIDLIGTGRYCDYCNSEEGLPRPIGNYIVKLEPFRFNEHSEKLACQCCRRKIPRAFKKKRNSDNTTGKHAKQKKSILSLF